MGLATGREIKCCCCCRDAEIACPYGETLQRERERNPKKVTLTQKTHISLADSFGSWNSSQFWSLDCSQGVSMQGKYYEVTLSKYFSILQFQTTFLLFFANPPSALKIKERNRTDGIRIFPVHLWAGKLTYIYKYPFCQPHERRWTVLFVQRQTLALCGTGLSPYCPCLGTH